MSRLAPVQERLDYLGLFYHPSLQAKFGPSYKSPMYRQPHEYPVRASPSGDFCGDIRALQ